MPTPTETLPDEPTVETPALETVEDIPYGNMFDDPMMSSLRETLGDLIKSEEGEKPNDPKPKDEPADPPADDTIPDEPVTAKAPSVSVSRAKPVTREDLIEVIREVRTAPLPPSPTPAPAAPAAKVDELELSEEDADQLATAEHAAKMLPDKYAEYPAKLKRFYRDQQEYIRQHEHEYGRTFDDDDSEWKRFVESKRPTISNHDRIKVERDRILTDARAIMEEEKKKLAAEFEARTRKLEAQPIRERKLKEFEEKTKTLLQPTSDEKFEERIYEAKRKAAMDVTDAYWRVRTGVETWDSAKNPFHQYLSWLLEGEAEHFSRTGGKARIRDGKQFVSPATFASQKPEVRERLWTFGDAEVVDIIAKRAKLEAEFETKAEFDTRTKDAWARQGKPAAHANGKPEPKPKGAATSGPGRAPGVASSTPVAEIRPAADIFEIRGLPLPGTPPLQ